MSRQRGPDAVVGNATTTSAYGVSSVREWLRSWRWGSWVIPGGIAVVVLVLRALQWTIPHHVGAYATDLDTSTGPRIMQDFRDTVWLPARDLLHGGNPYDTYNYLHRVPQGASGFFLYTPAILLVLGPLALLPWDYAVLSWTILDVCFVVFLAWLTVGMARLPRRLDVYFLVLSVLFLLLPTQLLFQTGNPSALVVCAAVYVVARGTRDWKTALAVALCLLKIQFGIPVIVLLLAIRQWRTALRGVLIIAIASAAPLALAIRNAPGIGAFARSLGTNLSAQRNSAYGDLTTPGAFRWDIAGTIGRMTGINFSTGLQVLVAVVLLGVAAVSFAGATSHGSAQARFGLASLTVMLCLFHNRYDLTVCLPAAIALLVDAARGWRQLSRSRVLTGLAGLLVLGVGLHAMRVDTLLHLSANAAQVANGLALVAAWALCVVAAWQPAARPDPEATTGADPTVLAAATGG